MKLLLLFIVTLTINAFSYAQHGLVAGRVTSSDGKPAEYVNIGIQGTQFGTVTNHFGDYTISLPVGNYTLVASIIGFSAQEFNIQIKATETFVLNIQLRETAQQLDEVVVVGVKAITGMGYLSETVNNINYSGKKTEVLLLDSLDANIAQNNPRQILGRVPGANYSETQGSGFPTNGIGFRGLNPTQSIETNTRQNGYNITADLYGYPESYYLPPLEAVERIEVTRGAASLQFGPQFGGVINYVMKSGTRTKPIEFTTQQTGGSFGFYSSFNSVGGHFGKFNYYGFVQAQTLQGWRPNSQTQSLSGFGRVEYEATKNIKIGVEYSILRNRVQMPGGFTDSLFSVDSRKSYRARNWLRSPWNVITATLDWKINRKTSISFKSTTNISTRELVWRNEDGGPGAMDVIDPVTNEYTNREVEHEDFKSSTSELRLIHHYTIGKVDNTLATGVRFFYGALKRQGGGLGTTGSDFDLTLLDPKYEEDLDFSTLNTAVYAENTLHVGDRFSITPGMRYEFLNSTVKGYNPSQDETSILYSNLSKNRNIFLAGIGMQFKTSSSTNIYANISQAYRPIDYSNLTPFGSIITVDKNLKDASGYNADLGFRGSVRGYLNFDIGLFYLRYDNRIGVIEVSDGNGNQVPFRTNIANSVHNGMESYIEFSPIKAFSSASKWNFSFFNSLAIINARYVSGEYRDKYVEYAPTSINRLGSTLAVGKFSTTFLISSTAQSFGDAANSTMASADAIAGIIPAYTVMDWSSTIKIRHFNLKAGVNNLADERYFTKRTDEYPGPGIIPSIGRSFYFGLGAKF
ncbi:MAG: TonB-dependent siderophore receptor [Cytophagales bacterium]|nr:TonB-dependent receptor [Bacteroidota bacterium]MBS1950753.1 TonB-dependent receptor [Bacteroidota bacterium]MBS1980688.1 TonB-dependent receptor [Bacteroidota bacterium]WHZ08017.1 MAG: TonB-dependent siderophore receptor [Cytophagales bacterium]